MGGKSSPSAPSYGTQIGRANATAEEALQFGRDQFAWGKEQDEANRAILNRTLATALPAMEEQAANARADRARYENTFIPMQDALIKDANEYDTAGRRVEEQGKAMADVSANFDAARRNALSRLEGYGVDPSQTRNAALDIGVRTNEAAAKAAAASGARKNVEDTGYARRAAVTNMGANLPGQSTTNYAGSGQAGASGVGSANQTAQTGAGVRTSGLAHTGLGLTANQQAGDLINTQFSNKMGSAGMSNTNDASKWANIGGAAGMAAAFIADGGQPTDRQAIPTDPTGMITEGPSDGSGIDDQVPAMLSVREYVIPADVVEAKGREFFDKLLAKYHTPAAEQRAAAPA